MKIKIYKDNVFWVARPRFVPFLLAQYLGLPVGVGFTAEEAEAKFYKELKRSLETTEKEKSFVKEVNFD